MLEKQLALTPSLRRGRRPQKLMKRRDARNYRGSSKARSVMRTIGHHSISLFRINMKKQEEKIIEK